jgi:hypothetical protein
MLICFILIPPHYMQPCCVRGAFLAVFADVFAFLSDNSVVPPHLLIDIELTLPSSLNTYIVLLLCKEE